MNAPPVAHRELLVAARRPLTRWIRLGAGMVATLIVAFGLFATGLSGRAGGGGALFGFLVGLSALVIICAGILLTADTISRERREGTLGFLFLTDLDGFDVLGGKLAASGLSAFGALLSVLPFMAITQILGGVTAGDFWRSTLALLNLLWLSLALGLAMSVRTRDASRALGAAFVWAALLCGAFPVGASLVRQHLDLPLLTRVFEASPVWALLSARDIPYQLQPETYWTSLATSHVVGWLFFLLAARKTLTLWRQDAAANPVHRRRIRRRIRAHIENPVAALNGATRREEWLAWSLVILTVVATGLLWSQEFIGIPWPVYGAWPFVPAYFLLKCLFAWKCCEFFYELRTGGGELLLTAPLHELQILGGAWTGARRLVQNPLIVLVVLNLATPLVRWLLLDTASNSRPRDMPILMSVFLNAYAILCLMADIVALGWLSARFGLRSRGAVPAFAGCLAILFLPRLFLFCVPDLLMSVLVLAWARSRVAESVRGWITGDRLPALRTRAEAARQGRIVPETV